MRDSDIAAGRIARDIQAAHRLEDQARRAGDEALAELERGWKIIHAREMQAQRRLGRWI